MSIAALIRQMAAAGAPPEAIALAVEAIEAAQSKVDEKRAIERDRKRRQRAKAQDDSGTVTGQSRDIPGTVTDNPSPSLPPNEYISNPPTHPHPDNTSPRTRGDAFPRPDWAEPQVWADLKANRKAKRLPCTPTAHAKLLRDLDHLADDEWPPPRLLEAIVARGWAAAYDPRENHHEPAKFTRKSTPASNDEPTNPYVRAVIARQAERSGSLG